LAEQILAVSPKQPCHYLGWSLGAKIAIKIASQFPERVQSIVLVTGNPCFVQRDNWPGLSVLVLDEFAKNLERSYQRTLRRFIRLQVGMGNSAQEESLQKSVNTVIEECDKPDLSALVAALEILKYVDLRLELAGLDCPLLCILGRRDKLVPDAVGEHINDLYPDAKIKLLSTAGHLPFITHEQEVCTLISEFIAS
jgi:pimeloyl-[acyl-carrier protein] methyl ester esterase